MECGIRLLHIAESTYHLGCMGTVGHAQIPCGAGFIGGNIVHNTAHYLTLFVRDATLLLTAP